MKPRCEAFKLCFAKRTRYLRLVSVKIKRIQLLQPHNTN